MKEERIIYLASRYIHQFFELNMDLIADGESGTNPKALIDLQYFADSIAMDSEWKIEDYQNGGISLVSARVQMILKSIIG